MRTLETVYEIGEPHPSWIDPEQLAAVQQTPEFQARQRAFAENLASGMGAAEALASALGGRITASRRIVRPALVPLEWCHGPEPARVRCWSPQFFIEVEAPTETQAAMAMARELTAAARLALVFGAAGDLAFDAAAIVELSAGSGIAALATALVAESEPIHAPR